MRKKIKCIACGRIFASYEKYDEHSYHAHRLKTTMPKKHYELIGLEALHQTYRSGAG